MKPKIKEAPCRIVNPPPVRKMATRTWELTVQYNIIPGVIQFSGDGSTEYHRFTQPVIKNVRLK